MRLSAAIVAAVAITAPPASAVGLVPVNDPTHPPAISGSAMAGQTLTCSPGSWLNSPTSYSYSWQRNLTSVSGQTGSQYTLSTADVGDLITCTVLAHNAAGDSLPAVSAPAGPVGSPAVLVPVPTALPAITGTPQPGNTLSCSSGSWTGSPTSYAYSWQRDGTSVADGSSYPLSQADIGAAITCAVVATNTSGSSLPAFSLPVVPTLAAAGGSGGGSGGSGGGSGASGGTGGTGGGSAGSGAGPSPTQLTAPRILSFTVVPGRMVVLVKGRRQTTKGTTFRYRLDLAASVVIQVQRRVHGHWRAVKKIIVSRAGVGIDRLKFAGRVGRLPLGAGSYRAVIVARNGAGQSRPRSAGFSVVHHRR